jgi:hypothetical protein
VSKPAREEFPYAPGGYSRVFRHSLIMQAERHQAVILALAPPQSQSMCSKILWGPNYFCSAAGFCGSV